MMSIAFAEFETATHSERFVSRGNATRAALLHCLIVSENAERREYFTSAAEAAGWDITVCADANAASAAAHRFRHSLVIVDLEPGSTSDLRTLTEELSTDRECLLMVCGSEGNPLEEIWA